MKKKNLVKATFLHCLVGLMFCLPLANAQLTSSNDNDCESTINAAASQVIGHGDFSEFCTSLDQLTGNQRLYVNSNCLPPANLSADALSSGSGLQLNWSGVAGATGYLITYVNVTTGVTTQVQSNLPNYTLNNLPAGVYAISVQTMCQDNSLSEPAIIIEAVIITDIAMIRSELDEKTCGCPMEEPVFSGPINEDELIFGWDESCPLCPNNLDIIISGSDQGNFAFGLAYASRTEEVFISECSGRTTQAQAPVITQTNEAIEVMIEGRKVFVVRFSQSAGMVIDNFDMTYGFDVTMQRCKKTDKPNREGITGARNSGQESLTKASAETLQSQPNPFNNMLQVQYTVETEGPATIKLYDYSGRAVVSRTLGQQQKGNHQLRLDTSHLPAGLYFLSYENGDNNVVQSVLKTN